MKSGTCAPIGPDEMKVTAAYASVSRRHLRFMCILDSEGDLILARLNATGYHEQSRSNIIGFTWAHPAFAGSRVYARSDSELVCVPLLPE